VNDTMKLADPENPQFGARIWTCDLPGAAAPDPKKNLWIL